MSPCREAGTPLRWRCTNHTDTVILLQGTTSTINVFVCWYSQTVITVPVQIQLAMLVFFLKYRSSNYQFMKFLAFLCHFSLDVQAKIFEAGRGFFPSPLLTEYRVKCLKQAKGQVFYIVLTAHFILDFSERLSKHQGSICVLCTQALNSARGLISMVGSSYSQAI